MNERIEQLADQCMTERQDSNGVYVEYFDHKKFAELIVRECIKLCDGNYEYKNNTDTLFGGGIAAGVEICKTQIAQHFGVE